MVHVGTVEGGRVIKSQGTGVKNLSKPKTPERRNPTDCALAFPFADSPLSFSAFVYGFKAVQHIVAVGG
jgi:hypothetical protein